MARGENTANNPNRRVGREKQYPSQQGAQRIGEELWGLVAPDMDLASALSKRKKQSKKK
jgi:hypothetical protein